MHYILLTILLITMSSAPSFALTQEEVVKNHAITYMEKFDGKIENRLKLLFCQKHGIAKLQKVDEREEILKHLGIDINDISKQTPLNQEELTKYNIVYGFVEGYKVSYLMNLQMIKNIIGNEQFDAICISAANKALEDLD